MRDVGEQRPGARPDRSHRGWVRHLVGVLRDAEDPELRVHRVDPPVVRIDAKPRDVVAVEIDLVAPADTVRRQHHREVGFARRAREPAADVVAAPGLLVRDTEEHELLGEELPRHPAVVRSLAQTVRDLPEQGVTAVRGAEVQDRPLVGDRHEVALIFRRPLPEVLQIPGDVDGPDEAVRVGEVVDVLHPHPRHADHVQHHRAVVGELDTGGIPLERGSGRGHQVGHHVHRLALGGAPHVLFEQGPHLGRRAPVVVDTLVGRVVGRHEGALFGAGGVLHVAARVVELLARGQDLAGLERLADQSGVVGCRHHLDPRRAGVLGPEAHVLPNRNVLQLSLVEHRINVTGKISQRGNPF